MKSKILLILIIFLIFVSSCTKYNAFDSTLYFPEMHYKNGVEAYENGNVLVAVNLAKAACDNGSYDDCNLLGRLAIEGKYLEEDFNLAFTYFNKGCSNDQNGYSCLYIGDMYKKGIGVKRDSEKRDKYYEQAINTFFQQCNDNNINGCRGLGESYLLGYINDPHEETAYYLSMACNADDYKACVLLGDYYNYKVNNYKEAFYYYQLSCKKNNTQGCIKLLDLSNQDTGIKLKGKSSVLYKADKMCKRGVASMCFYLGDMYRNYSKISRIKPAKSFNYIRYSCKYNHSLGCKMLGDMYYTGFGVKKNEGSAKLYYYRACKLGCSSACGN